MGNSEMDEFARAVAEVGAFPSPDKLVSYLRILFRDVPLEGRSFLDIGGGAGLASYYAALSGAKRVVCIEPILDGSVETSRDMFVNLGKHLDLGNRITLEQMRFQDYDSGGEKFDIVLMNNSINHLDEESCLRLHVDSEARDRYSEIFFKIQKLSNPRAFLVITDCSRANFFDRVGMGNPFVPTIEWEKHQSPETWRALVSACGFEKARITWTPVNRLGWVGRSFLSNRFAAYFLTSHFRLVMRRQGQEG